MHRRSFVSSLVLAAVAVVAEEAPGGEPPAKIRDNLFLLEEAYNQEPGVVQHIQVFQFQPGEEFPWGYTFTEEWPAPTDLHQWSVTVPLAGDADPGATEIGDVLLNYRIQALGVGGEGWIAMAPRLSIVLPTGDYETGAGRGVVGVQINLPVSIDLGKWFTLHVNGGMTVTPNAFSLEGRTATTLDANAGTALVWFPLTWFNVLLETVFASNEHVHDDGSTGRHDALVLNPGVRFAIDVPGGLQIVPGLSSPIEVWPEGGNVDLLVYLSLEHPLW